MCVREGVSERECEYYMRERERNDDVFYLFLQEHKLAQRYIPTEYLTLVIKKAYIYDDAPFWRHHISLSPPVDVVLLLAPTPPPLSVPIYTNDRH